MKAIGFNDKVNGLIRLLFTHSFDHPEVRAYIAAHSDDPHLVASLKFAQESLWRRGLIISLQMWGPELDRQAG